MSLKITRSVVNIDEEKCDGCGLCVPSCAEGAIQIIDGKAKLVSETYCDGLGACLGECPQDAITIVEREAEAFDEEAVEKHLEQLAHKDEKPAVEHPQGNGHGHGHMGCPSSQAMTIKPKEHTEQVNTSQESQLTNWPIQITLAPPMAPYFENADLLIAADCVPFAYPNFHSILKDKVLLIGCPKLDEADFYAQKLGEIIKGNNIKSVTVAHMEVPCCFGLDALVNKAVEYSAKNVDVKKQVFSISGDKL